MLTRVDFASRYKIAKAPMNKKESGVAFLLEAVYKKYGASKSPSFFNVIMGLCLNMMLQSCLKNTVLIFKEQQQNASTLKQLLWQTLTKS